MKTNISVDISNEVVTGKVHMYLVNADKKLQIWIGCLMPFQRTNPLTCIDNVSLNDYNVSKGGDNNGNYKCNNSYGRKS